MRQTLDTLGDLALDMQHGSVCACVRVCGLYFLSLILFPVPVSWQLLLSSGRSGRGSVATAYHGVHGEIHTLSHAFSDFLLPEVLVSAETTFLTIFSIFVSHPLCALHCSFFIQASGEAVISRLPDQTEARQASLHDATSVYNLLTIAMARRGQYAMLSEVCLLILGHTHTHC